MSLEHSPAREHNQQQQFLTERETAKLLRVSARTLQRWRLTGDGPPFCAFGGRGHKLPDCVKDDGELFVVFPLQSFELAGKFLVRDQHFPQSHKSPDNLNAGVYGNRRV